jgi:hypothetical protein
MGAPGPRPKPADRLEPCVVARREVGDLIVLDVDHAVRLDDVGQLRR